MGTMYALRESAHRVTLAYSGIDGTNVAERAAIGGYQDGFGIAMIFVVAAVLCSGLRGRDVSR